MDLLFSADDAPNALRTKLALPKYEGKIIFGGESNCYTPANLDKAESYKSY